jgi:hypothetical protein
MSRPRNITVNISIWRVKRLKAAHRTAYNRHPAKAVAIGKCVMPQGHSAMRKPPGAGAPDIDDNDPHPMTVITRWGAARAETRRSGVFITR